MRMIQDTPFRSGRGFAETESRDSSGNQQIGIDEIWDCIIQETCIRDKDVDLK